MDKVLQYSGTASLITMGLGGIGVLFNQANIRPLVLSGLMTGGTFGAFMLGNKRIDAVVKDLSDRSGIREESVKLTLFVAIPFFANVITLPVAFPENISINDGAWYGIYSAIASIAAPSIYSDVLIPPEGSEG